MTGEQHADTVRPDELMVPFEWYLRLLAENNRQRAENQRLRDALLDVLDVCTGWTRKMTVAEKLDAIEKVAREALRGGDAT